LRNGRPDKVHSIERLMIFRPGRADAENLAEVAVSASF
jgi:hypothetical protein